MTPEQEIQEFARLQPRLAGLWDRIFPGDTEAYTSVIVPSLTLDQEELNKISGIAFYEERLLFLLMRLRNPRARVVYVTSHPVHPLVIDYYLQLLVGVPASHARARLTMLCAYDSSPRALTQKILERPRLIERIRAAIANPQEAYLSVFTATELERTLTVKLGIPMNACDPDLAHYGWKSGSRRVFREAGVPMPFGFEDLRNVEDVVKALVEVRQSRPAVRRAVIKLNQSISGEGNAVFSYPTATSGGAIRDALRNVDFVAATESYDSFFTKFWVSGGVVEEFIEAPGKTSPSAQIRIDPIGRIIHSSTHEQILGGMDQQIFLGCRFPAIDAYRRQVQDAAERVGEVLVRKGVIGRLSVDFLTWPEGGETRLAALEINLRMGGTTHPMLALQFLTGGSLDCDTGLFVDLEGRPKYYRASDNVQCDAYHGLLPEDLIEILIANRLDFSYRTGTGVLFHMIGAVSQFGKVGLIAIGNSPEEADRLFTRTIEVLDQETGNAKRPDEALKRDSREEAAS